jgi:hypothetical protein
MRNIQIVPNCLYFPKLDTPIQINLASMTSNNSLSVENESTNIDLKVGLHLPLATILSPKRLSSNKGQNLAST